MGLSSSSRAGTTPSRAKQNNTFNSLNYLLTTSNILKIISIEIRHGIAFDSLILAITQDKKLSECNYIFFTTSMSNTFALPKYGFSASTNSIVTCPKEEKTYLTIMMKMEFVEITSASYLAQDTCTIRGGGGGEGRTKSLNSSAQLVHCMQLEYLCC